MKTVEREKERAQARDQQQKGGFGMVVVFRGLGEFVQFQFQFSRTLSGADVKGTALYCHQSICLGGADARGNLFIVS